MKKKYHGDDIETLLSFGIVHKLSQMTLKSKFVQINQSEFVQSEFQKEEEEKKHLIQVS